ncbi:MAG: aroB [Rhodospirillales bacterium]|nr:aroB [Rhodospirillales bacterium]
MSIERVPVALGGRSYEILVGAGLIGDCGALMRPLLKHPRTIVVTDANVAALHLPALLRGLDSAGIAHRAIVLPPGEETKSFAHYAKLSEEILALGIERGTVLTALGGGVVGDLVGFTAATLLRGIDFVQVPTTLLAQVDSSVGGKTAIDTAQGKNLVGAFHQPRLVLADTDALATLPPRELRAGYAEIVKYGLIRDPEFFAWLEGHGAALLAGDAAAQRRAVVVSCTAKAAVVAVDERETGERALLNFGHTFGHALEAETGFGDALLHGEAVAIGMALAFDLAAALGTCPGADVERVRRHFAATELPSRIPRPNGRRFEAAALVRHMRKDKKMRDGRITLILPRRIGEVVITQEVPEETLVAFLAERLAA